MSLCEGIREIVETEARRHRAARIARVRLEIGRFAGVEKPALAFAFDVVMRGSVAEGAALEMIDLAGTAHCYDCGETVEIDDRLAPCPRCGGGRLMPVSGDEMRIRDMEIA
jgi:hydrogenase nickel incorporation protein HypA/HybF